MTSLYERSETIAEEFWSWIRRYHYYCRHRSHLGLDGQPEIELFGFHEVAMAAHAQMGLRESALLRFYEEAASIMPFSRHRLPRDR